MSFTKTKGALHIGKTKPNMPVDVQTISEIQSSQSDD